MDVLLRTYSVVRVWELDVTLSYSIIGENYPFPPYCTVSNNYFIKRMPASVIIIV
jgi:hypothetical protein